MTTYIGCDPGSKGSICVYNSEKELGNQFSFYIGDLREPKIVSDIFLAIYDLDNLDVVINIEKLHAMATGVKANWDLGVSWGSITAAALGMSKQGLVANQILAKDWKAMYGIDSKSLYGKAKALTPQQKIEVKRYNHKAVMKLLGDNIKFHTFGCVAPKSKLQIAEMISDSFCLACVYSDMFIELKEELKK